MKKYRSILLVLVIAVLVTTLVPVSFASAKTKTKKMTVYKSVIKKKNTVYCKNKHMIYKVNLKTGKVKKMFKEPCFWLTEMKLYKGYLYYFSQGTGLSAAICRVKTSGKKDRGIIQLDGADNKWAISGSRIFFEDFIIDDYGEKPVYYSSKLNGKNRKKANCKIKMAKKTTNKKGYKVITKEYNDYIVSYLKKPNGKKIKLGKIYDKDIDY